MRAEIAARGPCEELERVRRALRECAARPVPARAPAALPVVNPSLRTAPVAFRGLAPRSLLRRPEGFARGAIDDAPCLESETFTLQWHLTPACERHGRHGHDRAPRPQLGCASGAIRPVCGGCLAVAHGHGLEPLRERDPLGLLEERA